MVQFLSARVATLVKMAVPSPVPHRPRFFMGTIRPATKMSLMDNAHSHQQEDVALAGHTTISASQSTRAPLRSLICQACGGLVDVV